MLHVLHVIHCQDLYSGESWRDESICFVPDDTEQTNHQREQGSLESLCASLHCLLTYCKQHTSCTCPAASPIGVSAVCHCRQSECASQVGSDCVGAVTCAMTHFLWVHMSLTDFSGGRGGTGGKRKRQQEDNRQNGMSGPACLALDSDVAHTALHWHHNCRNLIVVFIKCQECCVRRHVGAQLQESQPPVGAAQPAVLWQPTVGLC